jgi:hypothetical protein
MDVFVDRHPLSRLVRRAPSHPRRHGQNNEDRIVFIDAAPPRRKCPRRCRRGTGWFHVASESGVAPRRRGTLPTRDAAHLTV